MNAVAFISPQNHPILVRTFLKHDDQAIKSHYIAHTSLDVIDERGMSRIHAFPIVLKASAASSNSKSTECYLGLLYSMEDVAVYGYITPLKVKIVLALALSDSVVRDIEVNMVSSSLCC